MLKLVFIFNKNNLNNPMDEVICFQESVSKEVVIHWQWSKFPAESQESCLTLIKENGQNRKCWQKRLIRNRLIRSTFSQRKSPLLSLIGSLNRHSSSDQIPFNDNSSPNPVLNSTLCLKSMIFRSQKKNPFNARIFKDAHALDANCG